VVAVSPDDEETSCRFQEELELAQATLLDPDRAIAKAYQAHRVGGWLPNKRISYLIAPDGTIAGAHHGEFSLAGHMALLEE